MRIRKKLLTAILLCTVTTMAVPFPTLLDIPAFAAGSTIGISDTDPLANQKNTYVFTQKEETFVAPVTGFYQIDASGASGGGAQASGNDTSTYKTGERRYQKSSVALIREGTVLTIHVGGRGGNGNCTDGIPGEAGWSDGGKGQFSSWGVSCRNASGGGGGSSYVKEGNTKIISAMGGQGDSVYAGASGDIRESRKGSPGGELALNDTENVTWHMERRDYEARYGSESTRYDGTITITLTEILMKITPKLDNTVTQDGVKVTISVSSDTSRGPYSYSYGKDQNGDDIWVSTDTNTFTDNGTYVVKIRDGDGNESSTRVVITEFDRLPPTVDVAPSSSEWTQGSGTITITAKDADATEKDGSFGLPEKPYIWGIVGDDGQILWGEPGRPFGELTESDWTDEDSHSTVSGVRYAVAVRDSKGNYTIKTFDPIKVDVTGPSVSIKTLPGWKSGSTIVTITAADRQPDGSEGSGLADKPYSRDGISYVSDNQFIVNEPGDFNIWVKDKAGNITHRSETLSYDSSDGSGEDKGDGSSSDGKTEGSSGDSGDDSSSDGRTDGKTEGSSDSKGDGSSSDGNTDGSSGDSGDDSSSDGRTDGKTEGSSGDSGDGSSSDGKADGSSGDSGDDSSSDGKTDEGSDSKGDGSSSDGNADGSSGDSGDASSSDGRTDGKTEGSSDSKGDSSSSDGNADGSSGDSGDASSSDDKTDGGSDSKGDGSSSDGNADGSSGSNSDSVISGSTTSGGNSSDDTSSGGTSSAGTSSGDSSSGSSSSGSSSSGGTSSGGSSSGSSSSGGTSSGGTSSGSSSSGSSSSGSSSSGGTPTGSSSTGSQSNTTAGSAGTTSNGSSSSSNPTGGSSGSDGSNNSNSNSNISNNSNSGSNISNSSNSGSNNSNSSNSNSSSSKKISSKKSSSGSSSGGSSSGGSSSGGSSSSGSSSGNTATGNSNQNTAATLTNTTGSTLSTNPFSNLGLFGLGLLPGTTQAADGGVSGSAAGALAIDDQDKKAVSNSNKTTAKNSNSLNSEALDDSRSANSNKTDLSNSNSKSSINSNSKTNSNDKTRRYKASGGSSSGKGSSGSSGSSGSAGNSGGSISSSGGTKGSPGNMMSASAGTYYYDAYGNLLSTDEALIEEHTEDSYYSGSEAGQNPDGTEIVNIEAEAGDAEFIKGGRGPIAWVRTLTPQRIVVYSIWLLVVIFALVWLLLAIIFEHVTVYRISEDGSPDKKLGNVSIVRKKDHKQVNLMHICDNEEDCDLRIDFSLPFVLLHRGQKVFFRTINGLEMRNVARSVELTIS